MQNLYTDLALAAGLPWDGPAIRLLSIDPSPRPTDPISCNLTVHQLFQTPKYKALSYCWGGSERNCSIRCNGLEIRITENLQTALLHFRGRESILLWVDAICINQDDVQERQRQVTIMRAIYFRAEETSIWLGGAGKETCVIIRALKHITGAHESFFQGRQVNPAPADSDSDVVQVFQPRALTEEEIRGLADMLGRPWWERIWVVQEVSVAKSARIFVGASSIDWNDMACALKLLSSKVSADVGFLMQRFEDLSKLKKNLKAADGRKAYTMADLLPRFRWWNASDPRDKVYALLGLSSEPGVVTVDYSVATTDCYILTAKAVLQQSESLDILELIRAPSFVNKLPLPSWVPDWSFVAPSRKDGSVCCTRLLMTEEASNSFARKVRSRWTAAPISGPVKMEWKDTNTLVLQGAVLEDLWAFSRPMPPDLGPPVRFFGKSFSIPQLIRHYFLFHMDVLRMLLEWSEFAFPDLQTSLPDVPAFHSLLKMMSSGAEEDEDIQAAAELLEQVIQHDRTCTSLKRLRRLGIHKSAPRLYNSWFLSRMPMKMGSMTEIFSHFLYFSLDSRIARTASGRLALVPHCAQEGDKLALLAGAHTPYVVRPCGTQWQLVGHCYVEGMMKGEVWKEEDSHEMEFV